MTQVRNKPSADGYALGEHLDRFCEQEIEKYRQTGMAVPHRCDTCAFRKNTYANGCVRYSVKPRKLKDGIPNDGQVFDQEQLDLVKKAAVAFNPKPTGGPHPTPKRAAAPLR